MQDNPNKSKELETAIYAAEEAGKILEKYFETEILKNLKEDKTIVTLADKESEDLIKKIILKAYPTHSILGEETGMTGKMGEKIDYVWHVDPVDGTRNFANGIPIFCVSIALTFKGEPILGVVYNPATHSLFFAEKDKGAYFNNKKIFVSKDNKDNAIVTVCASQRENDKIFDKELLYSLPQKVVHTTRDLGSAALELAYVARGGLEANIQIGLNTYDFAAGVLLVQEAGGKITNFDGSPWEFPGNYFIASNGVFHDKLVEEVGRQKEKLSLS